MGFFDLFNGNEQNQKERRKGMQEVRQEDREQETEFANEVHMDLREEELDVDKQRKDTGDVVLHKEITEEEQTVNVPVSHDQVVIEQREVNHEPTDEPITEEESVRIPVTAEEVHADKHTVVTGEISAQKRPVERNEQVRDVLHKEKADVDVHGEADVETKGDMDVERE
ncbi:YsnF/AvaK domain-containing protein [Salipaludibacillus aurantiacus]|uniref:Conserved domain-containing protein n=1 Tax=Salipaludibacillus aurantiacus TaxID=1601833 RepID=A0A1H9WCL4_9BACI|nr:YsnF/AvaK domain-containing protein [Salipaludibacillus aurantiacus]SES31407.1 conserved domain-containing protein [Salipaludibacillus aurantiacus]